MVGEIELDLEAGAARVHERCREAARRNVEGDLPPVVDHRFEREADLSDDLGPHVKRVERVLQRGQVEFGPRKPGLSRHLSSFATVPKRFSLSYLPRTVDLEAYERRSSECNAGSSVVARQAPRTRALVIAAWVSSV